MAKKAANVNPDFEEFLNGNESELSSDDSGTAPESHDGAGDNSCGVVDDSAVIDYGENSVSEDDSAFEESTPCNAAVDSDEELVDFYISSREVNEDVVTLSINLKSYEIPVDTDVKVPKFVKEYWHMLGRQKTSFEKKANSMVYDS